MAIFHSREEYERWVETELPAIAKRMEEDPSRGISLEEMERTIAQWDAEDRGASAAEIKRSA